MRHWNVPVHIEISGRLWDLDGQSIHFFRDDDLAAQSTRFGQSKGHVQHVFLVLRSFFQRLEYVPVRKYHVTGAAGANALAGTLQLDVVPLGYLKQGLSHVRINVGLDGFPIAVHKRHVNGMSVVVVNVGTAVPSFGTVVVVVVVVNVNVNVIVNVKTFRDLCSLRGRIFLFLHRHLLFQFSQSLSRAFLLFHHSIFFFVTFLFGPLSSKFFHESYLVFVSFVFSKRFVRSLSIIGLDIPTSVFVPV
mmetsp:Transcript_13192/g.27029  ORF Transcript_13192/g.27029 Transcript_13192/m.27029 type:complete len:247 (+) Transcript_13192:158-898(+)